MTAIIRAAGVMFLDPEGNALFVRRTVEGDAAGMWAFPGGKIEDGETAEQAAVRECEEEIGFMPKGTLKLHTRRQKPALLPPVPETNSLVPEAVAEIPPLVDFTTFIVRVPQQFVPKLNEEHDGYVWSAIAAPPMPMHPGCEIAIAKLSMDELGIARAMSMGDLTSPQRYVNMTLWAMRITGTERSFRKAQKGRINGKMAVYDEHVYRPPEHYLTPDFLARCAGLPVIWLHPKKATLDSKEYADRVVGSVMLPYIDEDEVWGVVRVYDDEANAAMEKGQFSTSPTVVFTEPSVNTRLALDDGSVILIEGKPGLLDHLAICEEGVWDKGGEPSGVSNDHITKGDSVMDDEKKKADAIKATATADADATKKADDAKADGVSLSAVMDAVKSVADSVSGLTKRMDATDAAVADAVKKADASKKKDSDEDKDEDKDKDKDKKNDTSKKDAKKADESEKEKEKEKEEEEDKDHARSTAADKKKDAADCDDDKDKKKDAVVADAKADAVPRADFEKLQSQFADLAKLVPAQLSDDETDKYADAQAKADAVMHAHGTRAPRPMQGESLKAYNIRLGKLMQPHSEKWKGVNLAVLAAEPAGFEIAMDSIRADALQAGLNPKGLPSGEFRKIIKQLPSGHTETTFVGSETFIKALARPARNLQNIHRAVRH